MAIWRTRGEARGSVGVHLARHVGGACLGLRVLKGTCFFGWPDPFDRFGLQKFHKLARDGAAIPLFSLTIHFSQREPLSMEMTPYGCGSQKLQEQSQHQQPAVAPAAVACIH